MNSVKEEFLIPEEKAKPYKTKVGGRVAATLTGFIMGFIAGAISAGMIGYVKIYQLLNQILEIQILK